MSPHTSAGIPAIKVEVIQVAATSSPLLPTKTVTEEIGGHATTVITQAFADRIFITITQLNKFGCLYQAVTSTNPASSLNNHEVAPSSPLPPPLPTTSVSKLVGTEPSPSHSALYQLFVAQIASIVKHSAPTDMRPLVVSLALQTSPAVSPTSEQDKSAEDEDFDNEGDSLHISSEDERSRFLTVMELVQRCKVW